MNNNLTSEVFALYGQVINALKLSFKVKSIRAYNTR
jgi:hypothetical protein